jgi:hypothetical protein
MRFVLLLLCVRSSLSNSCWLNWSVADTIAFANDFVDALQAAAVANQLQRHSLTAAHLLLVSADDGRCSVTAQCVLA